MSLEPQHSIRRTIVEPPAEMELPAEIQQQASGGPVAAEGGKTAPPQTADHADADPFRPVNRPPMAVLHVYDDGRKSAEFVRIRGASFVIGRTEGDLVIPQDPLMSGKHAEIARVGQEGRYAWHLRDLGSTNGSFVRVQAAVLKDGTEFMIAQCRFRFVVPPALEAENAEPPPLVQANIYRTINWQTAPAASPPVGQPYVVELLHTGEGRRFSLLKESQWIGRDRRRCCLVLEEATISPCHARVFRDAQGRWRIEDGGTLNGVWIRIHDVVLGPQSSFLLGEQMFAITFP
jgi:pSer/pThr/pTyr-binding forkhead associated (FHA) protein